MNSHLITGRRPLANDAAIADLIRNEAAACVEGPEKYWIGIVGGDGRVYRIIRTVGTCEYRAVVRGLRSLGFLDLREQGFRRTVKLDGVDYDAVFVL